MSKKGNVNTDPHSNSIKPTGSILSALFIFSLLYAIVRYHIAGPVPWKDFPIYVMNKAIALTAFMTLSTVFSLTPLQKLGITVPKSWMHARSELGTLGALLMFIHGLMSLLIFNEARYSKFFEQNGTLTFFAGLSMLGGIMLFVLLAAYYLHFRVLQNDKSTFSPLFKGRIFWLALMGFSTLHLFFMGFKGWLSPSDWHGGLPPISLLGFVCLLISFVLHIIPKK
jgi:DMSO/TMAO reductase YedYZ heme-binding membrane subunit